MRHPPAPVIGARVPITVSAGFLAKAWRALVRWHRLRMGAAELQALDNRMLKDIGIERSEIDSVVRGIGRDATRVERLTGNHPSFF